MQWNISRCALTKGTVVLKCSKYPVLCVSTAKSVQSYIDVSMGSGNIVSGQRSENNSGKFSVFVKISKPSHWEISCILLT